ncbi:tastin isoform X3 [Symphalangus syndactylus]|uniref:tastin isoform X3 n=1 Tax=Symphalangus syndactylus TaxID=9590 RepID=UPI003006D52C
MTTRQATKDPLLRGVSPTPSKIPVRSQKRTPFPTVTSCALDQENQDPRRWVQKPPLNIQRPLVDSAGPRPKARHQAETSQRLVGITQPRNPLEELRPSPRGQNVGPGPPAQTEAPGTIEFVADPAALATILSGEGVKSCHLGRQPSLAKRVLVRGSQGGTTQRGQGVRASAYLAPRTPTHRLDPARASCFSRLEGPGPRGRTLCPQRLQALISPSGPSFHPSTRPSFQELRRETAGSSRTSVSQASGSLLETPVQPAFSLPKGEHEVVTRADEGGVASLGLAQRVPLRENREMTHTRDSHDSHLTPSPAPVAQSLPGHVVPCPSPFGRAQRVPSPGPPTLTSYSVLRRLTVQPKTRFTPMPSTPTVQQAQWLHGVSPQSCSEDPALPWEQVAVRLFDQESCIRSLEGSGKPPVATPSGPHSNRTRSLQEVKIQEQLEVPEPCPSAEPGPPESCCRSEPEIPEPSRQEQLEVPEPCPPAEPGPLQPSTQGQTGPPGPCPRVELGASEPCTLEHRSLESSLPPCCSQRAPATTSLIFSSQHPLCASPPICSLQSLRPPAGQAGLSSLAPRTLALRERLKSCLTAIHCFHEARLDDECAFYTSRAPPSGPTRVCTNPVATLLEWQDALCFIPVGSAAPRGSPS